MKRILAILALALPIMGFYSPYNELDNKKLCLSIEEVYKYNSGIVKDAKIAYYIEDGYSGDGQKVRSLFLFSAEKDSFFRIDISKQTNCYVGSQVITFEEMQLIVEGI